MNKRKITKLAIASQGCEDASHRRTIDEVIARMQSGKITTKDDELEPPIIIKGHLERFYAARLASKDYERSMFKTPQSLASAAFEEAVAATQVWLNQVNDAVTRLAQGCCK